MDIKKEGSLAAPTRDIVDWNSDEYLNEKALDAEMRRQFDSLKFVIVADGALISAIVFQHYLILLTTRQMSQLMI